MTQAEQGLQEAQARRAQAWARLGALLGLRPDEAAAWSLPARRRAGLAWRG